MSYKTPATILQELCIKKASGPPDFKLIHHVQRRHNSEFSYHVSVLGTTATGKGCSKKEAKQETARNVLAKLKELKIYEANEVEVEPPSMATDSMEDVTLQPLLHN